MKNRYLLLFLLSSLVVICGCQKEKSFEGGADPSEGSLVDDGSGSCLPMSVAGTYVIGKVLNGTTEYIEVQVNVTLAGSYTIYTDTANGIYFRGTGVFTSTGLVTVRLRGNGTPVAAGVNSFVVTYGTSGCTVSVTTTGTLAVFTLDGAPGGCLGATPAGTYTALTPLNASNSVTININATVVGAYNIVTAAANGMSFASSGVITITGAQAIVLTGSGTPATAGVTTIPVTAGSSSCSFPITVNAAAGAAVFTVNCASAVVNGTYTAGTALTTSNTVTINVNVTTIGTYSLTGTIGGMTFAASASFPTTGAQTVTLNATGTPTTAGANTVPLTGGTTPCNFTVTVVPAAGAATFTVNCATAVVNGTYTFGTALTTTNTVTISVNVTAIGSYSISGTAGGMTFAASGNFIMTGVQPVTLNGTGTPTLAGANSIPITAGTAPCNFTVNVLSAVIDYFPRTVNSNWSYEIDDDPADSLFRKVIAPTHTALGNVYNIFMQTDDASAGFDSSGYYRKSGGDYLEFIDIGSYIGFDNPNWVEYIFLKDNVAAGNTWTTAGYAGTISGVPYTARFKYNLTQKDVTVSVTTSTGTVSYPNTIVVEERVEVLVGAVWTDLSSSIGFVKNFYARGVGWIKQDYYDPADLTVVAGTFELRRKLVL